MSNTARAARARMQGRKARSKTRSDVTTIQLVEIDQKDLDRYHHEAMELASIGVPYSDDTWYVFQVIVEDSPEYHIVKIEWGEDLNRKWFTGMDVYSTYAAAFQRVTSEVRVEVI